MDQVYTSTFALLRASIQSLRPELRGFYFSIDEPNDPEALEALARALGAVWVNAADTPITEEGNYQCVLRSNHIVHVQALNTDAGLVLISPEYPSSALTQLVASRKIAPPPWDYTEVYHWTTDKDTGNVSLKPGPGELAERRFIVSYLAGPYQHCRMVRVNAPERTPRDESWELHAARLVNELVLANNQIVWYRATPAPPHYTKAHLSALT